MSTDLSFESISIDDCQVQLRRFEGPEAREMFLACQPTAAFANTREQAEAVYGAVLRILEAEDCGPDSIVTQTIFLRDLRTDLETVRTVGRRILGGDSNRWRPATTEIGQPPVDGAPALAVSIQAVAPLHGTARFDSVGGNSSSDRDEWHGVNGLRLTLGGDTRLHVGGLAGAGGNAYQQTHAMFDAAEVLLRQAGMEFSDVVRTWIHLREMERDYSAFNLARREFFHARDIQPVPASTAIGGDPVSAAHDLCLGFYAVSAEQAADRIVMTSPTLNEAMQYGADFVRGLRIQDNNKQMLLISGTASIDETGNTAHINDFDGQAQRMLLNIAALLQGQGATYRDIVSATTYVKHPADAPLLRERFRNTGFEGFPNVMVEAEVCRPELLCETEVVAILPRGALNARP